MRNIKLRGKSIKLGEWIYGNSFCSPEDEGVLSDNPLIKKDGVWVEVDKDTLSTYIGINDTLNNNKIYGKNNNAIIAGDNNELKNSSDSAIIGCSGVKLNNCKKSNK